MAKSNRRRRLDRAKREASASQRRAATGRRHAAAEQFDAVRSLYEEICSPSTAESELPGLIEDVHRGGPVPTWLVPLMLVSKATPERLAAVADAMLAGPRPSVTALSFAAAVARAREDTAGFHRLIHQALAATSDPPHRAALISHLHRAGRVAEAIELLEAALRADPYDDLAADGYGEAIEEVFAKVHEGPPGDDEGCPCGLGASWSQCCEPAERAALDRFTDNSGLIATRDAVAAWLPTSDYGQAVDVKVAKSLPADDASGWEAADRTWIAALMAEHALLAAHANGEQDQPDAEMDADTPLAAFAAAPATPAELGSRASTWRDHACYGLWRIDHPQPAPGLWCTEILSGLTRYVHFPAEIADDLPRWTVWLGAMVPVDGIWRCTGTGVRLSPVEGDAAAEFAYAAAATIAELLAGKEEGAPRPRRGPEPMRIGGAGPYGVLARRNDRLPPQAARFYSIITGELLSRIAAEVYAYRAAPPVLRNTDGDPVCLITARIAVCDGPQAATRLAGRSGFEADPDDPASITWYGLWIPDEQAEALMIEAMTRLPAQGHLEAELLDPDGPQQWVRGTLRIVGDQIVADVDSVRRLDRLIGVLERIGVNPSVIEEKRIGPLLDLPWPADEHAVAHAAAPTADGWEKSWLDVPVPALGGRSPRLAVHTSEWSRLEAMLCQWEYEADLLAAEGKHGIDTGWLRQELGMFPPEYPARQR